MRRLHADHKPLLTALSIDPPMEVMKAWALERTNVLREALARDKEKAKGATYVTSLPEAERASLLARRDGSVVACDPGKASLATVTDGRGQGLARRSQRDPKQVVDVSSGRVAAYSRVNISIFSGTWEVPSMASKKPVGGAPPSTRASTRRLPSGGRASSRRQSGTSNTNVTTLHRQSSSNRSSSSNPSATHTRTSISNSRTSNSNPNFRPYVVELDTKSSMWVLVKINHGKQDANYYSSGYLVPTPASPDSPYMLYFRANYMDHVKKVLLAAKYIKLLLDDGFSITVEESKISNIDDGVNASIVRNCPTHKETRHGLFGRTTYNFSSAVLKHTKSLSISIIAASNLFHDPTNQGRVKTVCYSPVELIPGFIRAHELSIYIVNQRDDSQRIPGLPDRRPVLPTRDGVLKQRATPVGWQAVDYDNPGEPIRALPSTNSRA
jgi:hypothetical protein